ncbi:hypothetical protein GCM10009678_19900 [Actinomadura kijaniata]|uniref:Uncharacterized protein n=1 Tax=Actinomadura namibiensis TaxID=182080 RepID=A0A7W3QR07_ACTNM|nr:hypothetical protein [Actinomadura namibiensis]MBA8956234.1 hypothetical protein [Actinomadura namibiensis]
MDDSGELKHEELQVGRSGRFEGVHYLHWEWTRLELVVRSRWRRRRVLCQLESEAVPWPDLIEQAREPGRRAYARFKVVVEADIVDHGHFGHKGTLRWRLSVRRWVSVERLP